MSRFAILFVVLGLGCGDNKGVSPDASKLRDGPVTGDGAQSPFTELASFDPVMGQLPEGITSLDNALYVGLAPLGEIHKIPNGGAATLLGSLPAPVNNTFTLGLVARPNGDIMIGVGASGANPTPIPGIYKLTAAGGTATLFASSPLMAFPNGLDLEANGDIYVADSAAGQIFKVSALGIVTVWATSPLLQGDVTACGGSGAGFAIGGNGIVHDAGFRYVANTDFGRIVKVPIKANGAAGTPVVLKEDCATLQGADGIALDSDGSIIVARNGPSNQVTRVSADGATVTPIFTGAPLDGPASVVIDAPGGTRRLSVTNSAFFSGPTGSPSVVALDL